MSEPLRPSPKSWAERWRQAHAPQTRAEPPREAGRVRGRARPLSLFPHLHTWAQKWRNRRCPGPPPEGGGEWSEPPTWFFEALVFVTVIVPVYVALGAWLYGLWTMR